MKEVIMSQHWYRSDSIEKLDGFFNWNAASGNCSRGGALYLKDEFQTDGRG